MDPNIKSQISSLKLGDATVIVRAIVQNPGMGAKIQDDSLEWTEPIFFQAKDPGYATCLLIPVALKKPGSDLSVKFHAMIDTGYTGSMSIPRKYAKTLNLEIIDTSVTETAGGDISVNVSAVELSMQGALISNCECDITEDHVMPLVGLEVLKYYLLSMDWISFRLVPNRRFIEDFG